MTSSSDKDLFKTLKRGSEVAFKQVYQDNRQLFVNFARKYGLGDADILDIYQDSYIVFYENVSNGRLKELTSTISTYLISIGKYKLMEKLRKNKKSIRSEALLEITGEVDSQLESFEINTEELTQNQKLLQLHFAKLGDKCKAILSMFYYKNMSIAQIMEAGNYNSENVVKSQKSRCLKTLKEAIKTNKSD